MCVKQIISCCVPHVRPHSPQTVMCYTFGYFQPVTADSFVHLWSVDTILSIACLQEFLIKNLFNSSAVQHSIESSIQLPALLPCHQCSWPFLDSQCLSEQKRFTACTVNPLQVLVLFLTASLLTVHFSRNESQSCECLPRLLLHIKIIMGKTQCGFCCKAAAGNAISLFLYVCA